MVRQWICDVGDDMRESQDSNVLFIGMGSWTSEQESSMRGSYGSKGHAVRKCLASPRIFTNQREVVKAVQVPFQARDGGVGLFIPGNGRA